MRDIQPVVEKILSTVSSHRLESEGRYTRRLAFPQPGEPCINEYGVADAANILYTFGALSPEPAFRWGFTNALKGLQNPVTGLFSEPTHHTIHTTAHCSAALELFDQAPALPTDLLKYKDPVALYELLESIRWVKSPWDGSHIGAGIYVALTLSGAADRDFEKAYFDWLWQEADPRTGLWRRGALDAPGSAPLHHHMAGTFHYLFNHEYAARPIRYPDRLIDTQLSLYHDHALTPNFGQTCGFLEIDWIFCLTRAMRQSPHRFAEGKEALRSFAGIFFDYLDEVDPEKDRSFDDLHSLFGASCAVAELYRALPGEFSAKKPPKLVLDRRPFI